MLDPKASLAIDAPPIAPYDDGYSTESEDILAQDDTIKAQDSVLSHQVSKLVQNADIPYHPVKIQRQEIQDTNAVSTNNRDSELKTTTNNGVSEIKTTSVVIQAVKNDNNAVNGALKDVSSSNNVFKEEKVGALSAGKKIEAEYCKSCKGYLMPLVERTQVLKTAMLQHVGNGAPLSRECCCCHNIYPLVALTDESKSLSCTQPRCYMCHWTTRRAKKDPSVGDVTGVKRSAKEISNNVDLRSEWCRRCKGQLPTLAKRLEIMNGIMMQYKKQGQKAFPPSRQCTCCFITYPFSSLTVKSRSVMCTTPECYTCSVAKDHHHHPSGIDDKAQIFKNRDGNDKIEENARPNLLNRHQLMIEGGSDEEDGELIEQEVCQCCLGTLVPLAERLRGMKEAETKHKGKGPPPSRQCACCRITYPFVSLTAKSRNPSRVVPICVACCTAGGSAIYEMLTVSDEFFQAFKVENPEMAKLFRNKKESGTLARMVANQRERMLRSGTSEVTTMREQERLLCSGTSTNTRVVYMARQSIPCPSRKSRKAKKEKRGPGTHVKSLDGGKSARARRLEGRNKKKERFFEKLERETVE